MYHEINGHIWEYLLWVECSRRTSKVTWSRVSVTSRHHLSTARADGAEASVFSRPRISTVMDMALLPFYHKNICLPFIHEGLFIILLVSFPHITQLQPTGFSLSLSLSSQQWPYSYNMEIYCYMGWSSTSFLFTWPQKHGKSGTSIWGHC